MVATPRQSDQLVALFKEHGTRMEFRKGDTIIKHHETPSGVFFIEHGLIKAYDITKYHEENLLIIRRDGEVFPIIWGVLNVEQPVLFQAIAPTVVWRVSRRRFQQHIKNNPELLAPLLDMALEMYRIHNERILNLEYRTVRERIVSFLLTMAERFGTATPEGIRIDVPLRHQDIASSINATRETTSREIAVLERRGLLMNRQSVFTLCDKAALHKVIN